MRHDGLARGVPRAERPRTAAERGELHILVALALAVGALAGCDCAGSPGDGDPDGGRGHDDATIHDDGGNDGSSSDGDASADARTAMPDATGPVCDLERPCLGDARCVDGHCERFGTGEFDGTCRRPPPPGPVLPEIQCSFEAAPPGDPYPGAVAILHTPLVADFGIAGAAGEPSRPSIVYVASSDYDESPGDCVGTGVLRILDGATCRSQAVFGDVALNSPVTPAIGDLDRDGRPEIVAAASEGGLVALRVGADGTVTRIWSTTLADGTPDHWGATECQWGGVSLYDLDDDGLPEVLFEGAVWGPDGERITTLAGWAHVGSNGSAMAVGDYDGDGYVEAVGGNHIWQFDPTTRAFVDEPGFWTVIPAGQTAVADLGSFPDVRGDVPGGPEVVSVMSGRVYVTTLGGGLVAEIATTTEGIGGPPTIADFDGDGAREIGVAFGRSYEVFDLAETDSGQRLWSSPAQDASSSRTGSSVFDFNADGRAEVVYGDECFVRVYDGRNGDVVFSQGHFSWTWLEYITVADPDADGSAEMIVGSSDQCRTDDYCPAIDPVAPGLRCEMDEDCTSGVCDLGFCRCSGASECPATYACSAPLEGTPGTGDVCRPRHAGCRAGIRVYRDTNDRWAASRPIWNQHAYHVTNVEEDGTIPRTSEARTYWSDPRLDNFRQNVQGVPGSSTPGPDLTIQSIEAWCDGPDSTDMRATICNRGVVFLDSGVQVTFDQIDGDVRERLCDLTTTEPLAPGSCTTVSCTAPVAAEGLFEATADEASSIAECSESNNYERSFAHCVD